MNVHTEQAILDQIKAIRTSRESTTAEQNWIIQRLTDPQLKVKLPDISIVGLHLLSALQTEPLTGIVLAQQLGVTRGGVTRAAKKLVTQGLLQTFQKPTDHKKIFYQLTPTGRTIAQQHDAMHRVLNQQLITQLKGHYSPEELSVVLRFLTDLTQFEEQLS
ncbi:MarR family winged helix-turn-helix transcriptional regulator [Levilactobacillus acidifarinae]|uniref:Transcription regulator n=1 Tax=Levilactobacillus acidifarinae DSM 19394 = JCM 15949 TaxID=1423715 RepID=A0A0R1LTC9_9LACO|nr:MarR family transcriptional regulator [Levilactobacillus acidifarinae]KRK96073.1 transcription regulator [Levilactobacillus acidifarinae DSM 19394]GEO69653.1 MarR family transcriptional regulator [Levilactobacillus acidifarinae]